MTRCDSPKVVGSNISLNTRPRRECHGRVGGQQRKGGINRRKIAGGDPVTTDRDAFAASQQSARS
jgi:hypothetical protein